jgi:hypothetical protein
MDAYQCTTQAKKCRQLAAGANSETHRRLIALAEEHEVKAIKLDEGSMAGQPPQKASQPSLAKRPLQLVLRLGGV